MTARKKSARKVPGKGAVNAPGKASGKVAAKTSGKAVKKPSAKKKVTRKKVAKKMAAKKVRANAGGSTSGDATIDRQWGTPAECLTWLADDGFPISRPALYKTYGPSAEIPVKIRKGKWSYLELLERVKSNRMKAGRGYDEGEVEDIGLARRRAQLRLELAKADRQERLNLEAQGLLISRDAVRVMVARLQGVLETGRKTMVAEMAGMLEGKPQAEIAQLLERATRDWLACVPEQLRGMK